MTNQVKLSFSLLALAFIFMCGCGSSSSRYGVTGEINFKGKPLDQGSITFQPESQELTSFAVAAITDGRYSVPADQGLMPGTYRVIISSGDPTQKVKEGALPGESGPPAKERIPKEFNEFSKITFEVKAGSNVFNKDIP